MPAGQAQNKLEKPRIFAPAGRRALSFVESSYRHGSASAFRCRLPAYSGDAMSRLLTLVFCSRRRPPPRRICRRDGTSSPASDWQKALERSNHTAILPIGVLEKHGPHAPIGSDLIHAREWAARVAKMEYAVVFPDYFYGQIYEARHQPGTFALPSQLIWDLLDSTCEEIARNGFKKILIVNAHGGNPNFLRFFVQSQLERTRDYVVYLYDPAPPDPATAEQRLEAEEVGPATDAHAGERETSTLLYLRPDLVHLDRARSESGANEQRLVDPGGVHGNLVVRLVSESLCGRRVGRQPRAGTGADRTAVGLDCQGAEGGEERHRGAGAAAAVLRSRR